MRAAMITAFIILASTALGTGANAESARFSIAPEHSDGGAFFSYTLGPGLTVSDAAVVQNRSSDAITLRLYAADAVTATNGGTAFMGAGQFRDHMHVWLATTVDRVTVPGLGSARIPFRVAVPADVTAGDHIAGLVVEAAPQQTAAGAFAAAIVQRAGVAVVVHVPGRTSSNVALGEVCLNQENGSNYFQLVAANQGDVLTKAKGELVLKAEGGAEVFRQAVDIGTVLPHDSAFVRLDAPLDPGPGRFVASLRLTLTDGSTSSLDAPIVVGETKTNGCAKADAAPAPQAPTRTTAQIAQAAQAAQPRTATTGTSEPVSPALLVAIAGGVGLLIGAGAIWVMRRP